MRFTNRQTLKNWRIDDDGMLRVTAQILADGVYEYGPHEVPKGTGVGPDGLSHIYIPLSEFTADALKTLEGKPVIMGHHEWRDTENTQSDGLTVGAVAGKPEIRGPYVVVDLLINEKSAIDGVVSGKLTETSAAYDSTFTIQEGQYKGQGFNGVQKDLRFNHVLLLPEGEGRCNVKILNNKKAGVHKMAEKIIQMRVGNKTCSYRFTNEDDAREGEKMAEDQKAFNADELAEAVGLAQELKVQIDEMKAKYDEALKVVEAQKAQIDELMSAETQDALAQEALAQGEAEAAIVDEAVENEVIKEEEKEEIKNRCQNARTLADRRRVLVQRALALDESVMQKWDQKQIDASFDTLAMRAQNSKIRRARTVMGGVQPGTLAQAMRVSNAADNTLNRIRSAMRPAQK